MRILLLLLLLPSLALAQIASPTDYIRTNIDAVISILKSPEYMGESNKTAQLNQIEAVVDTFFDPQELSKRSLAQYWKVFSDQQKQEFQTLFLKLIKQVYLKKSVSYNNEIVTYTQEIIKSDTLAEVYTTLTSPTLNIPIVYYLIRRENSWAVYDVSIENISLTKNYRSQFQSILQNNPPEQLLTILREKTRE